jgi:hypothetical protein
MLGREGVDEIPVMDVTGMDGSFLAARTSTARTSTAR